MTRSVHKFDSFAEADKTDRDLYRAMDPNDRVALVEQLRRDWSRISGQPFERLRRTARVLHRAKR